MANRIICIGRECGSGGRELAEKTARSLGIPLYDKELLELACQYGEVDPRTLARTDEKATNPYLYTTVHEGNEHVLWGAPASEVLFNLQSHEIRRLANQEECVFLGRCADFVLRRADVRMLRVFVTAPLDWRIARMAEVNRLSPAKAKSVISKIDKQRRKYYESYTKTAWGDPARHDLVLNTAETGMDRAVQLMVERFGQL